MRPLLRKLRELARVDLRALAAMRIALGAILVLDLVNRARFLPAHYGDQGIVPPASLAGSPEAWPFSLHLLSGALPWQALLFLLAGAFAVMLLLGWKTRVAAVASFLLLMSLHGANPYLLHGADAELRLLLFFAMFVPLGARWSLDARKHAPDGTDVASTGSAALLLQVGFLYLFAALQKTGAEWHDGTAVWYALSAEHYGRAFAAPLLAHPELLAALSSGILALQLASFPLLFSPWKRLVTRTLAASLLILMQLGFLVFLKLGFFPLISISALLPFLPPRFWNFLEARVLRLRP